MVEAPEGRITRLLGALGSDPGAEEELLSTLYEELRRMARAEMARVAPGQTLQPTALVHEAYLRLVDERSRGFENRRHFFFAAARAMHDILVEQARRKAAKKRGGDRKRVDAHELVLAIEAPADDLLALDDVLRELERDDPMKFRIVQLRFFAGLPARETADTLGIPLRTLEREWRYIRARLHKELSEPE